MSIRSHGRWLLPETEVIETEAATIYVLHDVHALDLDPVAAGFQIVISGHSHKPGRTEHGGVLFLNPGSAGPRRFHLPVTIARLDVSKQAVERRPCRPDGTCLPDGNSDLTCRLPALRQAQQSRQLRFLAYVPH